MSTPLNCGLNCMILFVNDVGNKPRLVMKIYIDLRMVRFMYQVSLTPIIAPTLNKIWSAKDNIILGLNKELVGLLEDNLFGGSVQVTRVLPTT